MHSSSCARRRHGAGGGRLYLAISIYILHCPLCARLYYRFAKLTFLWWNNGVAEERRIEENAEMRASGGRRERERARKGQFDVNRSIVIRVNRLPHCSSTVPRTQSMIFVLLYFIYFPSGREKCRWLRRVASVYGRLPRETRSDLRVTDDGKRKTWALRRDEIDIFGVVSVLMHSKLGMRGSSLSYNCATTVLNLKFVIFMIFSFQYLFELEINLIRI